MRKRFLAILLTLVLAFSTFNGYAPVEAENALTEEKMKEALIEVKSKIDIGDEFTEFDYSYNEYTGNGRFYFNWSTEDGMESISITADGDGRIWNYNRYTSSYNNDDTDMLPTYIGEELVPKAEEWLYQTEPALKGKLDLTRCSYQTYRKSYIIGFTRIENGIRMNDNSVSITLDAMDAKVLSYNLNWNFEVEIPKVDKPIGEAKAAEKVDEKVNMELQYRLGYDNDGNQVVFLAYNPDTTYVAIDAKNGKIYTERSYWGSNTDFDDGFNKSESADMESADESLYASNGRAVKLSDNEIKKIDEVKDILTSEQAVNLVKKNKRLYIDQNLTTAKCRLYFRDGEYYWNIYLSDDRPLNYDKYDRYDWYRASASAQVNAKTGKLISFSASTRDYYEYENDDTDMFAPQYTKKQCQKLFEEFAKELDPEEAKNVKIADTYENKVYLYRLNYDTEDSAIGGYSFNYHRYYKDILFSANGISGAVEAVTGKVTRYNLTWTDAKLPEPETAISEKQAFDAYISYDGFDLVYELVSKYEDSGKYYGVDKEVKARLVYRTAISPNLVDAFTGKQLSWNGQEYKPAGASYKYTDINGTKYERSIKLLADMGLGFDGEEFKPAQIITNEEFEKLLVSNYSRYYSVYADDTEDDDTDPEDLIKDDETRVTRQEAARLIISALGGEKLAKMDIFKTGYSDEKKIAAENLGSVALCKGLGIMGAKSGKKFKPNSAITRGEAADLVIRMMSASF